MPRADGAAFRFFAIYVVALPLCLVPIFLCFNLFLFGGNETAQRMLMRFGRAPADVAYFGDSVIRGRSSCDTDERGIDDYLRDLTGASVALIAHPGYSVRQFSALVGLFNVTAHAPKVALLPFNLRSLSVTWGENPGWQFGAETYYVRALSGELSAAPRFVFAKLTADPQSDLAEWRDRVVAYQGRTLGRLGDLVAQSAGVPLDIECAGNEARYAQQLGVMYRLHYLTEMASNHPLLAELADTVGRLREAGIAPIVYLTPINVADAERYGGPSVGQAIRSNAALVAETAGRLGVPVLNLATDLAAGDFADRGCACEHLTAAGRRYVAERLAPLVNSSGSRSDAASPAASPALRQTNSFTSPNCMGT